MAARVLLGSIVACLYYAGFAGGAQEPTPQSWTLIALTVVGVAAAAAILYGQGLALRTSRLAVAGIAGLAGFALWAAIGIPHSVAPDRSWAGANAAGGYALVAGLGLALGSSLPRPARTLGLTLGAVMTTLALYALIGKMLPGILDTQGLQSRLQAPIGYWNALALCCVSGLLPLLVRARDSLPALLGAFVLALTLALTYSRGALFALACALAVLLWLAPHRGRLLALIASVGVAVVAPVAVAGRRDLSTDFVPVALRTDDGLVLLATTVVCGALLLVWGRMLRDLPGSPRVLPRLGRVALAMALVAGTVALSTGAVGSAWASFTDVRSLSPSAGPERVLSVGSGARWAWWREAAGAFSDKPLTGWGAGSFVVTHRLYRSVGFRVEQPHNVPLQWLAEDGVPGLLLAGGGLLALLAAGVGRVRRRPEGGYGAALVAVAVAWIAQAPFEWTWDIPAATFPMLLALGVLSARPARPRRARLRGAGLAGVTLAGVLLVTSVALPELARQQTNRALDLASGSAPAPGRLIAAARSAELGVRLDPVGTDALLAAADIAERRGRPTDARRYLLRAVRRQPYDVESWQQLARVEFARGDRVAGLLALQRGLSLDRANGLAIALARQAYETAVAPGESATATGTPLVANQASSATP